MSSTIDKYLVQIQDATKSVGIYAYRGQEDSEWRLHSGATRRLIEEHGCDIVHDPEFAQLFINYHRETLLEPARTRGFGSELGRPLSDLQLLAKLQHFGAMTGLLDFTWSPLFALWIAGQNPVHDGKLFVINTNDPIRVARIPSDETYQNLDVFLPNIPRPPHVSYWEPMASGDAATRILRQRSVFIIGSPLIPTDEDVVWEIPIDKEDKGPLLCELQALDFHQESLFQDVYGFAQASTMRRVPDLTPDAYRRIGNRHFQGAEYREATLAYTRSIDLDLNSIETFFLRGNAYAASGHHNKAMRDYDHVIAQRPAVFPDLALMVHFNRANSNVATEDYDGAISDYLQATRLSPNAYAPRFNLANTYADLSRFEEAIVEYDKALQAGSIDAYFNKGNALMALGRFEEALRCYEAIDDKWPRVDRSGIDQNLWAARSVIDRIRGLQYTTRFEAEGRPGAMLAVSVEIFESVPSDFLVPRAPLVVGRVGNIGNYGGYGIPGGEGAKGRQPMIIHVRGRTGN